MNGPKHYQEAERLLRVVGSLPTSDSATETLIEAQVHATLALAAATITTHYAATDWAEVTR